MWCSCLPTEAAFISWKQLPWLVLSEKAGGIWPAPYCKMEWIMNASRRTKLHLIFIQRSTSCSRLETGARRVLRRLSRDRKRCCPSITRCCHYPQLVLEDEFIRSLWDSFAGKVGTLEKRPDYCAWAARWAEDPPECLLDNHSRWGAGKFAEWGLCCGQRTGVSSCWSSALGRRRARGMSTFSGGCIAVWVGIWELSPRSKLALSNKHFDSSWNRRQANFSEGSGTVSQEKISSWSCSKYNLVCKPRAAESYYTHVHTIELRAQPLRPFLGDPYKIPLTKAALCAGRGTPASDVKNGK